MSEKRKLNPDVQAIQHIENELTSVITERLKGAQIRSRTRWIEEGEKPTSYFFKLERTKQCNACISKLNTPAGDITSNEQILETITNFYQALYSEETVNDECQKWLLEQLETSLDDRTRSQCEGPSTREEADAAIAHMHLNKSPGPDGLTIEFYKTFWSTLAPYVIDIFNLAFEYEELTSSQKESLLHLLFKKGNRLWLKNWRPISLLNCDYKILATTLYKRLQPTLPYVIHDDQTCGVPNRTIYEIVNRIIRKGI